MTRIHAALATRVAIIIAVALVATAAFVARGVEPGVTFATKGIDLKIDSKAWYNGAEVPASTWALKDLDPEADKFFNFDDIKPGDFGCNVISMHVKKSDAWMCLDFKNLEENENGENEPEGHVDTTDGADLADGTEFFGWVDDGDGVYEPPGEKALFGTSTQAATEVINDDTYVIGDSKYGGVCKPNTTRYVGMCWCAGDLVVDADGEMTCDASALGNEAQTDSFTVDMSIRVEPAFQKPKFVCGNKPPHDGDDDEDEDDDDPPPPPPPPPRFPFNIPRDVFANWGNWNSVFNSSSSSQGQQVNVINLPPTTTDRARTTRTR